jgi:hypothetical protein
MSGVSTVGPERSAAASDATAHDALAARVEELQRERDALRERCQQREAELEAIHGSRMWRWWMRYHALRRALGAVLSQVLAPGRLAAAIRGGRRLAPAPTGANGALAEATARETPAAAPVVEAEPDPAPFDPEPRRPRVTWPVPPAPDRAERSVLVLGIYLANRQNNVADIIRTVAGTRSFRVEQRWIAMCGGPPSKSVAAVTVDRIAQLTPKGAIVNAQIAAVDLARFDYVVLCDDDVVLPLGFLDSFLTLQERLAYRIAQPARTIGSYIDLPIVEQHPGLVARQTLFVEQGPVISVHRSAFDLVFPFDLISPMGWGLENVWSLRASERGLKMGIIDNVPVDHSMRRPVANYSWHEADHGRSALLASTPSRPTEECFKVVDIVHPEDLQG